MRIRGSRRLGFPQVSQGFPQVSQSKVSKAVSTSIATVSEFPNLFSGGSADVPSDMTCQVVVI